VSATPYSWGHEHFCVIDATELYYKDPNMLHTLGFPVALDANPEPPTFCSICLFWFDNPSQEGSGTRPPERGTHGKDS
jgi:hypothetical protein